MSMIIYNHMTGETTILECFCTQLIDEALWGILLHLNPVEPLYFGIPITCNIQYKWWVEILYSLSRGVRHEDITNHRLLDSRQHHRYKFHKVSVQAKQNKSTKGNLYIKAVNSNFRRIMWYNQVLVLNAFKCIFHLLSYYKQNTIITEANFHVSVLSTVEVAMHIYFSSLTFHTHAAHLTIKSDKISVSGTTQSG